MEMDLGGDLVVPWGEDSSDQSDEDEDELSEEDWIKAKGIIKDGVKREVGVDGEEVQERVGEGWTWPNDCLNLYDCVRFTRGSASCLLVKDKGYATMRICRGRI